MSQRLRAAFQGEGADPFAHLRRITRLRSEWPALFEAIADVVYDDDPVDLRDLADRLLEDANKRAERMERERQRAQEYELSTMDDLRTYLDDSIWAWRRIGDDPNDENQRIAAYYVDAFQSVRVSLLGDLLPLGDDE